MKLLESETLNITAKNKPVKKHDNKKLVYDTLFLLVLIFNLFGLRGCNF